ncbi:helix-turn-helix transcriptional regulator [Microbacterium sp. SSW1-49]|uniref:Helix-turn-helix transcriptional regulator n=2 Tax=Microbacterium croceum TaxID=2851645 RepID=A0ABT0FB87_9MICO|nr:helix-turn-helix transcriptional regulator [Microbacterium croceum]
MTQEQVAQSAQIDVSTYARMERRLDEADGHGSRASTIMKVLRVLHVPAAQIERVANAYW